MLKTVLKIAASGLALFQLSALAAAPEMEVNGSASCLNLHTMGITQVAQVRLTAGTYKAKIVSNDTSQCGGCGPIEPLVLSIPALQPQGSSIQKLTSDNPVVFTMPIDEHVFGFFTDSYCSDNSGKATVRFIPK